ncbi:MAG: SoxR reducing system RseC family protein [Treponema sp.]|jgi:sigma-E factor negative regulatory protein RseC|nr:SoxR reducing system RseC family protein [Treponema sp.]
MDDCGLPETGASGTGVFTKKALVREIKGRLVTLELGGGEACFGCMNRGCRKKPGLVRAENRCGLSLSPGQSVTAAFPLRGVLVQGLGAILPPLAGFPAGYAIAAAAGAGDGLRIGGGFAGLLAAALFPLIRGIFRGRRSRSGWYIIA